MLSLASSSKRIIQIAMLLAERNMTFSFCLNEPAMLQESMVGVSFQAIAIGPESALFQENWKLVTAACDRLESQGVPGSCEFRALLANLAKHSGANKPRPTSTLEGRKKSDGMVKIRLDPLPERRVDLRPAQTSTQDGSVFLGPTSSNSHLLACSEQMMTSELKRFRAENMRSYTTALNLDCMTFSAPPIHYHHAGRADGSKPADWEVPFSALEDAKDIHESVKPNSQCPPPSLGGFSSLASSSPKHLNSANGFEVTTTLETYATQSCSPTDPWSSDSDFHFSTPYYLRQRGVDPAFNDNSDPQLESGATAAISPELTDGEFMCTPAAQSLISPPPTGAFGDVELFGVDLSLVI
jgi:hypothetical protein